MKRVERTPERLLYDYEVAGIAALLVPKVKASAPQTWFCLQETVDKYAPLTDVRSAAKALGLGDIFVYRSVAYELKAAGLYVAKRMGIGGKNRTTIWASRRDFEAYLFERDRLLSEDKSKTAQRDHALRLRGEP